MVLSKPTTHVEHDAGSACDHILELTGEEHTLLRAALDDLPAVNINAWDDELITEVELRSRYIPEHLAKLLSQFRKHSNEDGMLLLRNLPIDHNLPPTPDRGEIALEKTSYISEYVLLAIMLHLGEPIAYEDEKNGMLIQNICPVRGKEEMQENTGSTYLEFHTEDAFHPYRPDFVGLLCLRPDHERVAATAAASIRRAFAMLPGKTLELLRQPLYRIRLSSSFTSHTVFSPRLPVLRGDVLEPDLSVDFYGMEALTPPAQLALKTLEEALLKVAVAHRLVTGDLMIIDNRVAAHARTAFPPRYDGQDRWLQRLFVVHDFRRSRASRSRRSHICVPLSIEFSALDLEAQST